MSRLLYFWLAEAHQPHILIVISAFGSSVVHFHFDVLSPRFKQATRC